MITRFSIPFFLLASALSLHSSAQENEDWRLYKPKNQEVRRDTTPFSRTDLRTQPELGNIKIVEDQRITKLNEKKKENPTKMDGYRVQIYFGDRKAAQEKRGEFIRSNPDTGAYISYLAPNFRLRVGDFRTRLESEKFKKKIARDFPGSYIVKDKIELPPLREEAETLPEDSLGN